MNDSWIVGGAAGLLLVLAATGVIRPGWFPDGLNLSVKAAFRLNVWALVALGVSFAARLALLEPGWSDPLRAALALAPLLPVALYSRDLVRWVRGLDELQRRIQVGAFGVAGIGLGLSVLGVELLQGAGFLSRFHWNWEFAFAFAFLLWMIGCRLSTRRHA